jgi:hypothetical protein
MSAQTDIFYFDQLPPKTCAAFREANCAIIAKDTYEWMRRSGISDEQAAAFIRGLNTKGRAHHWALMEGVSKCRDR